jgi:hypothetical protein
MKKNVFLILVVVMFFLIQTMDAQTWTATKRITWNSGDSEVSVIAADSNNYIHVVWGDETPGNSEIFYKKSTDGGTTWTTKRLTWNNGHSYDPNIAIDSNNYIHVVWPDLTSGNYEICYKKSTDGGTSWATKRLTYNSGGSDLPVITADSNNHIHVVWRDYSLGYYEIYYKRSTDGGATWTTKRLTYTNDAQLPAITADSNNNIYVVYRDFSPGNGEIFYKKSTDGGTSWTTKRLTYNSGNSWFPNVAVDTNNHVHVVWQDWTPGNAEIYWKMSTNGGATWTTKRLTYNSGGSVSPGIAVDSDDHIHVAWNEYTPGNPEIYYKRSTNGGSTWTTKRLAYNSGRSYLPTMVADPNNNIHVVWHDETPGNFEIYYKKGIQ